MFDDVRNNLQELDYIEQDPFEGRKQSQRFFCSLTYSCTMKDPFTGVLTTIYKTPEVNPIGGEISPIH